MSRLLCDHDTRVGNVLVCCFRARGHQGSHKGRWPTDVGFYWNDVKINGAISSVEWNDDASTASAFDAGVERGRRAAVPNPQNIVEPTPLGRKIRRAIMEPGGPIYNADYSALETRIHAHYHNELPEECRTRCPLGGTKKPCASCPHGKPEGR